MTNQPDEETELALVPLTESDVGTTLACGCEVTRVNIPCGDLAGEDHDGNQLGHDYPDTGCGYCQFGVPAVYHECQTA